MSKSNINTASNNTTSNRNTSNDRLSLSNLSKPKSNNIKFGNNTASSTKTNSSSKTTTFKPNSTAYVDNKSTKKKKEAPNKNTNKVKKLAKAQSYVSSKVVIGVIVAACLIFGAVFLYFPAKEYYYSVRNEQKAEAQLNALKNTNEKLRNEIEYLQTPDGIKQRASDTLGLVESGLSTGIVNGLSKDNEGDDSTLSSASSKLAYKQIKAPTTFYSPFFDWFFDYS